MLVGINISFSLNTSVSSIESLSLNDLYCQMDARVSFGQLANIHFHRADKSGSFLDFSLLFTFSFLLLPVDTKVNKPYSDVNWVVVIIALIWEL